MVGDWLAVAPMLVLCVCVSVGVCWCVLAGACFTICTVHGVSYSNTCAKHKARRSKGSDRVWLCARKRRRQNGRLAKSTNIACIRICTTTNEPTWWLAPFASWTDSSLSHLPHSMSSLRCFLLKRIRLIRSETSISSSTYIIAAHLSIGLSPTNDGQRLLFDSRN